MFHKPGFDTKIDLWTYNSRVCIAKFVSANPRRLEKGGKIYAVQTLLETKKSSQTLKVNVLHYMGGRPSNHFILVKSAGSFFRLLCYTATFWMKKWNLGYMDKKSWEKEAVAWDEDFIVFCGSPVWCMRPIFTAKKQKNTFSSQKI